MSKNNSVVDLTALTYSVEFYSCLIVGNIGLVANLLNIMVSQRPEMQKTTAGFYNILMSSFNILTLIVLAYLIFFPQSTGREQYVLISNLSCVLILYSYRVFAHMAAWLNVVVTLDRMLCVTSPSRFKIIRSKRRLSFIVLGLLAAICGINSPNFLFSLQTKAIYGPGTNQTSFVTECTASKQVTLIRDILSTVMRVIVPIMLRSGMNAVLVYKFVKARHSMSLPHALLSKEFKFAFTVIVMNVIYFVVELPVVFSVIFVNLYGYNETHISTTSNESAIASFVYVCSFVVSSLVYVSLFFVNLITNKLFREEFKNIYSGN